MCFSDNNIFSGSTLFRSHFLWLLFFLIFPYKNRMENTEQFRCDKCPTKIFKNKYVYKVHMTWKHKVCICKTLCEPAEYFGVLVQCKQLWNFICEHCHKLFTSTNNKNWHVIKKHTVSHCDVCNHSFIGANYRKHLKFHALMKLDEKPLN